MHSANNLVPMSVNSTKQKWHVCMCLEEDFRLSQFRENNIFQLAHSDYKGGLFIGRV